LTDHLGTPRVVVDGGGTIISEQKFTPFGESLTTSPEWQRPGKGFTNHEQTDPSGLIYMQARFCLPMYGRFEAPDPEMDQDLEDIQSWNLYSYVRNNPINSIDATGTQANPKDDRNKPNEKPQTGKRNGIGSKIVKVFKVVLGSIFRAKMPRTAAAKAGVEFVIEGAKDLKKGDALRSEAREAERHQDSGNNDEEEKADRAIAEADKKQLGVAASTGKTLVEKMKEMVFSAIGVSTSSASNNSKATRASEKDSLPDSKPD